MKQWLPLNALSAGQKARVVQVNDQQPALDGGFTWKLTPQAQLDLYLGEGLNEQASDLFVGAGFSFRLGY